MSGGQTQRVVLPAVKPGVVAGCILVFVPSLGAFLAPDLLGGAKTFMIGSLIEEQFKGMHAAVAYGGNCATGQFAPGFGCYLKFVAIAGGLFNKEH